MSATVVGAMTFPTNEKVQKLKPHAQAHLLSATDKCKVGCVQSGNKRNQKRFSLTD